MHKLTSVRSETADLYLSHVDESQRQRLVPQDGPIFVPLPPLQHDLQLVGVPLQEVRILWGEEDACKCAAGAGL